MPFVIDINPVALSLLGIPMRWSGPILVGAAAPTGTIVPFEFMPGDPEHEFTCQEAMLRGRISVEAT